MEPSNAVAGSYRLELVVLPEKLALDAGKEDSDTQDTEPFRSLDDEDDFDSDGSCPVVSEDVVSDTVVDAVAAEPEELNASRLVDDANNELMQEATQESVTQLAEISATEEEATPADKARSRRVSFTNIEVRGELARSFGIRAIPC
jgi:hypothetical protein